MSTGEWEQRLQESAKRVEEELRRLTAYINDEIVPDIRRHGSHALRAAADEMNRLAKRLDEQPPPPDPGPEGTPRP